MAETHNIFPLLQNKAQPRQELQTPTHHAPYSHTTLTLHQLNELLPLLFLPPFLTKMTPGVQVWMPKLNGWH